MNMNPITLTLVLTTALGLTACVESGTTHESAVTAPQMNPGTLIGMRAGSLDGEMDRQGFHSTGGYKKDMSSFTTWYNAGAHQCISVETREGKIANAETIVEGNCL
jgi:hypothetical protein